MPSIKQPNQAVWKPSVTVAAVIEQKGTYLMVEEWVDGKRTLNQPAGHLEYGESLIQATCRETLEETGCHYQPTALLGMTLLGTDKLGYAYLRFSFTGELQAASANAVLDKDITAIHWLSRAAIEHHPELVLRSDLVLQSIDLYESGMRLPLESLQAFHLNAVHRP